MRRRAARFRLGDHYIHSDRTGRKIRASEATKEWTGALVEKNLAIDKTRHPQEFQKIVAEKQNVDDPRPRPVDIFGGHLTTYLAADGEAGDTSITVDDTTRFEAGDSIGVMLQRGDRHKAVVFAVTDATHLQLTAGLPKPVETGGAVVNYSAVTQSDLVS